MSDIVADLLWILSDDSETVRLQLPALPIEGIPEPLRLHLDFDAVAVDEMIGRLTVLRSQMLPAPSFS